MPFTRSVALGNIVIHREHQCLLYPRKPSKYKPCISYFSVSLVKYYNQKQFNEELILAYSSRGLDVHRQGSKTAAAGSLGITSRSYIGPRENNLKTGQAYILKAHSGDMGKDMS